MFSKDAIEEIVRFNVEQRGIVCIDEFDKLIKDVNNFDSFRKIIFLTQKLVMKAFRMICYPYLMVQIFQSIREEKTLFI